MSVQMSDLNDSTTLEPIGRMLREAQTEQCEMKRDLDLMRPLLLSLVEQSRRTERRISELKDDLKLMTHAELMGNLGHYRNQIERKLDDVTDCLDALESK